MKREEIQRLIRIAEEQMSHAYAPYSHFQVGAALLTAGGKVYAGCNIENAAYTPSNCAERTAFFKAVSEGERKFSAICIVGGMNGIAVEYTAPCGVCRQVMMEFCQPETFQIILAVDEENYKVCSLRELFPLASGRIICRNGMNKNAEICMRVQVFAFFLHLRNSQSIFL